MKRLILLTFTVLSFFSIRAQSSQGTDFWIASTYPFYTNDTFTITVASEKPTMAYLEIPLMNYKDSVKLGYNEIKSMTIPVSIRNSYYYYYSTALKKIGSNAIHVHSDLPVRVYSFSGGKWYSCGATAVYPTVSQPPGGVYYPYKARYNWSGPGSNYKVFFFTVIAIDDSTTVTFNSNSSSLWNLPPGYKILLRKGEMGRFYTYIQGFDPTLSVTASPGKRIAVFTENFYDYAITNCFQYDLMYEQILPDNILGNDFILTPFMYHKKGYDYTVTATENNTIVKKDNSILDTLNTGETYYGRMYSDSSVLITADKPINCWEKNILDSCNSTWWGWFSGPSIMTISTSTQMITDAVVSVPSNSSYTENFINIITTKFGKDSLWIDGTRVPPAAFKSILGGSFYLFRDTLLKGNHRITCNYGFISYIYGRGKYGGYAYNATAGLQSLKRYITNKTYISCDTGRLVRLTSEGDPARNYQWTFNGQSDTGLVAWFQAPKPGTYAVKLKYQLLRNNKWDSLYTNIEVKGVDVYDWLIGKKINVCNPTAKFSLPKSKLFRYKWSTGDTTNEITISSSGTYSVQVTNTTSNCKFLDTAAVSLYSKMTPGFTISMKKACPGIPIYLKNTTTFGGTDSATGYTWYVDNLYHSKTKNDTVKYAYPGTYDFRLVIQSKNGCTDSAKGQIKVGAAPTLISGKNTYDSCFGRASYKFNSRSSLSLGKIAGYQWVFSDGDTTYKKVQALREFKDSGLYWYQISAYSDAGCADTTPKKYFRIYGAPKPSFKITDSSVCKAGNYFDVKNTSNAFNQQVRYEWMWGDGSGETYEEPGTKNYTDTGKYKIRLISAYLSTGCSDTFDRWVRVLPNPKASFVIDSSNFCLNNSYYAFRENSDAKGAAVRYTNWNWGDGTSTKDSLKYRKHYTKTGTFRVTLYFSTGKGCLDSIKKNVVVYPSPKAVIQLKDSNICGNKNYFNLDNGSTAPANAKWYWNYGDGNVSNNKVPGKISYATYGNFTISLVAHDPLYNCKDTTYRKVNVLKGPKMDARLSDTMVCDTQFSITFTDSTNYGNIKPWHLWKINTTDTSSKNSITRKFKTPGVCADTLNTKVQVKYTLNPVSISKKINYPCEDANVDLSANILQGSSWNYSWDPGTTAVYNTQNVTGIKYVDSGNFKITLKVTDNQKCTYTIIDSVKILAAPELSISNLSKDTQCISGNNYQFDQKLLHAKAPVKYAWSMDESKTSVLAKPSTEKYANTGSKNIRLIITDANGCFDTAFYSVFINPSPNVSISSDSMCLGENRTLKTTVKPVGIVISKTDWFLDNLYIQTSNSYTYNSSTVGNFKVKAIVTDIPKAKFGVKMYPAIGTGVPVDFLDSSTGATKWTWYPEADNRNFSNKNKKYNHLYPQLGPTKALLVVENANGCKDSSYLDYLLKSDELAWFPSSFTPNGDGKNDLFKPEGLTAIKSYSLVIYNRWGSKIFETNDPMKGWDGTYLDQPVMTGSYVYSVNLVFLTGKRLVINNNFTLMR